MLPLVCSSFLFLFPAAAAAARGFHSFAAACAISTAVSALYWIHPVAGARLTLDKFCARFNCVVFSIYGLYLIWRRQSVVIFLVYPIIVATTLACFAAACYLHDAEDSRWWIFHIGFHIGLAEGQYVVATSYRRENKI